MKLHIKRRIGTLALLASASTFALAGGGGGSDDGLPLPDDCETNCGYAQGDNPTLSSVSSASGPFSVSTLNVSSSVSGFGGGTVYFPDSINNEVATIAISPGFTASQSSIAWWGPVLASNGFIVITIDTNSRFDQPDSRGRQLDSALSYLIGQGNNNSSPLYQRIDENRLAAMGHSMGGGGTLRSAARNRLSAAVPLAPWRLGGNNFNQIEVPTMIMACENDLVAPTGIHASPFYNRIPGNTDKVYLELNNGDHGCANGGAGRDTPLLATYGVSWMKRFLDKDSRYNQFLCGPNHESNSGISEFRDTCTF
jgi:triacylglycerol lipase